MILDNRFPDNDEFLWGDEIEYSLIRFNHENKRVQLCLKANEILKRFQQLNNNKTISELSQIRFHAEDCNFVIEGIPLKPYHSHPNNYYYVQSNMILRREQIQKIVDKNEFLMTISAFPRLGCAACTHSEYKSDPLNSFESSICCSDHFKTSNHSTNNLSLTTACPIWRGYLSNVDRRWNILSRTTDDRTKEEIENNILHSSRYSSVSCYLSQTSQIYNDIKINIDHEVYQTLINNDCPEGVARHFAHLFLRDPLYVTDEQVYPTGD
ncbi:unnamed protein product [Rotaria magnacalcarata]|uniref:Glutamate--cysteine ligase n=1 Tax=Rotaria magnacalcarata TaxID=392030 RepID=A0A816WKD6_9BILA|nr:unnamed protein product [Rotaria magnacalcarata]